MELNKRRITGRVSEAENLTLIKYANFVGLKKAQLVNLLVIRALYHADDSVVSYKATYKEADVTIMLPLKQDDEKCRAWARSLGIEAGPLVACLVRMELREKWLAKSILSPSRLSQIDSSVMV